MPEREGKNRVCGCKALMHGLVVLYRTHTTHTQGPTPSFLQHEHTRTVRYADRRRMMELQSGQ